MATNAELLAKVGAAIVALLDRTGQSMTIHQRRCTYLDLDLGDLMRLREELGALVAREDSGTGGLGYGVPSP